MLGIAAIIGAGIFSTVGTAASRGGPAVVLLFAGTAVACGFAALCYAEFASAIPLAGSAYTYAYVAFGELLAWIIGWDLLLEYAIGNIVVAISWSDYFTAFLDSFGLTIPYWLRTDYLSASNATELTSEAAQAWQTAPTIGSFRLIADLPALCIVALITYIVYIGVSKTKKINNVMVALKLAILAVVVGIGIFNIDSSNWKPFIPNGLGGVLSGVAAVFFAYIGFDALSTTAEEVKNPSRTLPRGIMYSLIACTIIYIIVSLVLTGMVPYQQLAVGDPLAYVFEVLEMPGVQAIVAGSAILAIAGVLLVFQLGQPRILMSMSRDGLLPPAFSRIHPKFRTPSFSTIVTGFVVAIPALFMNIIELTDLTVIGTLFAFIIVCAGTLRPGVIDNAKFKVPYADARIWLSLILVLSSIAFFIFSSLNLNQTVKMLGEQHLPMYLFYLIVLGVSAAAIAYRWSLIPSLGVISCSFLMCQLEYSNWIRFFIWMSIGLVVYGLYGFKHSKLVEEKHAV